MFVCTPAVRPRGSLQKSPKCKKTIRKSGTVRAMTEEEEEEAAHVCGINL